MALYGVGADATVSFRVDVARADLVLRNVSARHASALGVAFARPDAGPQATDAPFAVSAGATLVLRTLGENWTLVIVHADPARYGIGGVQWNAPTDRIWLASGPDAPAVYTLEPFSGGGWNWPNVMDIRTGGLDHHFSSTRIDGFQRGAVRIYASGLLAELTDGGGTRSWPLTRHERGTAFAEGTSVSMVNRSAVFGSVVGNIKVSYAGPHGNVVAAGAQFRNTTRMDVALADGELRHEAGELLLRNESHVDLEGLFTVDSTGSPPRIGGRIETRLLGDIVKVREDRLKVYGFGGDVAASAVGVAALIAVVWGIRRLAQLVGSWPAVRILAGWRLTASLATDDVLANPARRRLFELIRDELPFARLASIQREARLQLGMRHPTVYYHLHKLRLARMVEFLRPGKGRALHVGPNHGRYPDVALKAALSMLHHPAARALADAVVEAPGRRQAELIREAQRRLSAPGPESRAPSRIALFKWLRRLQGTTAQVVAGREHGARRGDATQIIPLVRTSRAGRSVSYWPTAALTEARRHLSELGVDVTIGGNPSHGPQKGVGLRSAGDANVYPEHRIAAG